MSSTKRIGLLTGGGDAPGLNGIIEAVVRSVSRQGIEVVGIRDGFEGIFNERTVSLSAKSVSGFHAEAGTLLGTSNKSGIAGREDEFRKHFANLKLDG
ncbi:MAG: 6-phosphofructokinase [Bdellovibrionota bacterium]